MKAADKKEPVDWRMREIRDHMHMHMHMHERELPEKVSARLWKGMLDDGFSPQQALYTVEREYREKLKKERDRADVQI